MARHISFAGHFLQIAAVCLLSAVPLVAHADELKLKDGSTVKGTIVGFDDNSFKVETSYGYAVVKRDQVASISMSESSKADAPEKTPLPEKSLPEKPVPEKAKPATVPVTAGPPTAALKTATADPSAVAAAPAEKSVSSSPALDAPKATATRAPQPATAPASAPKLGAPPAFANAQAKAAVANMAAAKAAVASVQPTAPAAAPTSLPAPTIARARVPPPAPNAAPSSAVVPKPPASEPIRETVSGNMYTNNTYRFQMYKPPDWQVLAAERTVLPGAIAALGTDDQETYLLIGQEPAGKPLYMAANAVDTRLRDVMDNFRPQNQEQMLVAGLWSTAHHFRGTVDDHEWSGVVVLVPHGSKLYTIFGMTRADSDLVQIQENVIDRAIASLQFSDP